jgi:DNA repair photolyase
MNGTSPTIISASRRTDLPAFYTEWLKNRLKAGFCAVVNPFNAKQISMVSLLPSDVRAFIFWTKCPGPMLRDKELFSMLERDYDFYFLFTINGYPSELEPALSHRRHEIIDAFRELSERIGKERVIWRYDPIIISDCTDYDFHHRNFAEIAGSLSGKTKRVIVSVVDFYRTVKRRFSRLEKEKGIRVKGREELEEDEHFYRLMGSLREIAGAAGLEIQKCCEPLNLEKAGIGAGKCIDEELISRIARSTGGAAPDMFSSMRATAGYKKDPGQREGCLCTESREIGAPLTCRHQCLYCYASPGDSEFVKTEKRGGAPESPCAPCSNEYHDPRSPSLYGWFCGDSYQAGKRV